MHCALKSLLLASTAAAVLGFCSYTVMAATPNVPTRAGKQYFEVRRSDGSYQPLYVKGMNLSVAIPGHHPSEFPRDEQLYRDWLVKIGEMNCNAIRLYTILPPELYKALKWHNEKYPDKVLWLIQGVWVEPAPGNDFLDQKYLDEVLMNVRNAVNLVHGKANFPDRPGWTGGKYTADVSPWMLAWLLGREWEPDNIEGFQKLRPDFTAYQGQSVSCYKGTPIECWFAQICDYCVTYEDDNYKVQHPVTFSSWPPTDPLSHVSESNLEDESDLAGLSAETRVDVFSSDSVNITSKHFNTEARYQAGLYASYHVYPYWPDFLNNEPRYKKFNDRSGPSSYYGYLADLKNYYNDRPLLIAEYGLPNGPLPVHIQPQGWNHGGLSEQQVARDMPRLSYAIYDSGCAGGVVFAWIDEWFKKVWLWAEFYNPWDDRRLWFNFLDAEENYGMIAYHPGSPGPTTTLSGNSAEWPAQSARPGVGVAAKDGAPRVSSVSMTHDEGYLNLRIKLENFSDWEFKDNGLYIGFDVLGDELGNAAWPSPLTLKSDRGLEEVLTIAGGQARVAQTESYRFWEPYRVPYSPQPQITEDQPHTLEAEDNPWAWFEPVIEINRRRVGKDGAIYDPKFWEIDPLPRGSLLPGPDYNDLALWNVNPQAGVIEIRMPWILLGFVGPHQMRVLQANEDGSNGSVVSEGVGLAVVLSGATGTPLCAWPGLADQTVTTSAAGRYTWKEWTADTLKYHIYDKPVYFALQELFAQIDKSPPQPQAAPPPDPVPDLAPPLAPPVDPTAAPAQPPAAAPGGAG
jgi:hypothetical protein